MAGPQLEGEAGKGELNNAASWDDFPNGRFGDYKSPAYGETDLWGSSILSVSSLVFSAGCPAAADSHGSEIKHWSSGGVPER